jgi:hypothetical protein
VVGAGAADCGRLAQSSARRWVRPPDPLFLPLQLWGSLKDRAVPGANSGLWCLVETAMGGDPSLRFAGTKVGSRGDGPPSAAVWARPPQFVVGSYKTPRPNGGRRRVRPRAARLLRCTLRLPARAERPGVEVAPRSRRRLDPPGLQATGNAGTAIAGYPGQHKETTRGRFHQPNTVPPTIEIVSGLNSNRTQPKSPPITGVQPQPAHQLNGISPLWCPWRKRQGHFPDCKKVKLAMQEWAETPVPGPARVPRPPPASLACTVYSLSR